MTDGIYTNHATSVCQGVFLDFLAYSIKSQSVDSQNIDFGDWVKQIREGEGWNQEELAQKLGVAQSYLSRIERGERPPTEPFCIALSAAFNFPIYTVLVRAGLVKDDEEFAAANALKTINEREDADVWEFKRRIKKIKNKEDREQALDNIWALLEVAAHAARLIARRDALREQLRSETDETKRRALETQIDGITRTVAQYEQCEVNA